MRSRRRVLRRVLLPALTALLSVTAGVSGARAEGYANPQLLIETEELAGLLGADGLRIVDLRGDPRQGEQAYSAGHIPGAVFIPWRELDDRKANAAGFPMNPRRAAKLFGTLGIDHETTVVAYDDAGGLLAARLFFVLEYFGHAKTRVLNGGLMKWKKEGRPLSSEPKVVPSKVFDPRPRRELLATAAEVQASLGKEPLALIDARSPNEYDGTDVHAKRGGHIPGAQNVEWMRTLYDDWTFKSADELRGLFAGARPDGQTVTYCQTGVRAAHDYFALRLIGYGNLKVYDGSWLEWGNDPQLPLAK